MSEEKAKPRKEKKKGWMSEFKEFALRGSVIDMAVGIIIGGAFGKIATSLVENIFSPIIGVLTGGEAFSSWSVTMQAGDTSVELLLGNFLSSVVDFLLIALCVFMTIKMINAFRRKKSEASKEPEKPAADIALLTEIRDLLKREE